MRKPNIILVLIDDLGWSDLTCCGSSFYETSDIDQFASDGVRLHFDRSLSGVARIDELD